MALIKYLIYILYNSVDSQILCEWDLLDLWKTCSVISLLMFVILKEGPLSGSENFDEISARTLWNEEESDWTQKRGAAGKGLSRYRESPLRKPPSQPETARYLGMFYTSLGNNVLLPGWIISGMRRPSRQMARTGGNCGLLLALVSPVGCESRNGGRRRASGAATATLLTPPAPFVPASTTRPSPPPAAPLLSTARNYSRDSNAGMRISPL